MSAGDDELAMAMQRHRAGDFAAADRHYRRAVEAGAASTSSRLLHGACLLQAGRVDDSIALLESLVADHPALYDAWNNLGVGYRAAGRIDDSERAFRAALSANPEYVEAVANLAVLLESHGRLRDAEPWRRQTILRPDDVDSRFQWAGLLKTLERWSDAEVQYRGVLSRQPGHRDALVGLGFVLAQQKRFSEAEEALRRIPDLKPEIPVSWANVPFEKPAGD